MLYLSDLYKDTNTTKGVLDSRLFDRLPPLIMGYGKCFVHARVGSVAHNTNLSVDDPAHVDDEDTMTLVLPHESYVLGLKHWDGQDIKVDELDGVFYSVQKFIKLLLKSNPNVIGLLFLDAEHYLYKSPEFETLIQNRANFMSKKLYKSFTGYAYAQMKDIHKNIFEGYMGKNRRKLVEQFGYDVKSAAHLIRLLKMGIEAMEDNILTVTRTHDAAEIRAIKRGEWELEKLLAYADELFARAEEAFNKTTLPDEPNDFYAEQFLINVYKKEYGLQ